MYSENIRRNDHYWTYDEKQVHLESQLDPAKQTLISPHVEQFIDDKADIINGDDVRKTFVSSKLFAKKSIWCGNIFGSSAASAQCTRNALAHTWNASTKHSYRSEIIWFRKTDILTDWALKFSLFIIIQIVGSSIPLGICPFHFWFNFEC